MKKRLFIFLYLAILSQNFLAQSIDLVEFSSPYPWLVGIENAGDSRLFIIQQNGFLMMCDSVGVKNETPFLDWSSRSHLEGEQGLLGLAFHPNYSENGYFYIYYSREPDGASVISRLSVDANNPNLADPNSEVILLTFSQPFSNHNGGCLKFGSDGYLYISSGDGGSANDPQANGQATNTFLGKMLRIDVDNGTPYSIPPTNPFINDPNVLDEIWAYGLRNPWKFSFDRLTGDMWIGDVGQNAREEIDYEPAGFQGGANYGWRCYEGSIVSNFANCDAAADYRFPIFEYPHNNPGFCKASVTGGFVYRGLAYADLYGKYIFADYCSGELRSLTINANGIVEAASLGTFTANEYTSLGEDYQGELYLTGYSTGKIFKLQSEDCSPVVVLSAESTTICNNENLLITATDNDEFSYQWFINGNAINGENAATISVHQAGNYSVEVSNAQGCTTLSETVTIDVLPPPTIVGEADICLNEIVVYTVEPLENTTYEWTVVGGTIVAGQGTNSIQVLWETEGAGVVNLTRTTN